jgi:hypothetical protein
VFSAASPDEHSERDPDPLDQRADAKFSLTLQLDKKGAMMIWRSDTSTLNRIMIQPLD